MSDLTNDPVVALLYEIARDHVDPEELKRITMDQMKPHITGWVLSNPKIAHLAKELDRELKRQKSKVNNNIKWRYKKKQNQERTNE